jgi:hypothetical protein
MFNHRIPMPSRSRSGNPPDHRRMQRLHAPSIISKPGHVRDIDLASGIAAPWPTRQSTAIQRRGLANARPWPRSINPVLSDTEKQRGAVGARSVAKVPGGLTGHVH